MKRLQMATELGIQEERLRNFERGATPVPENVGRRISQRYMVSYEWIVRGNVEDGFVIDIFEREHRTYNEARIAAIRDRYDWSGSERTDLDFEGEYTKFLAWVTAAQILAYKVERIEDFASVMITVPHRPDPHDQSRVETRTFPLAEALSKSFNSDFTPKLWDKEPLLAVDCAVSGSPAFKRYPLEQQVEALRRGIDSERRRFRKSAEDYCAKGDEELDATESTGLDWMADAHARVWERLNKAAEELKDREKLDREDGISP